MEESLTMLVQVSCHITYGIREIVRWLPDGGHALVYAELGEHGDAVGDGDAETF
jgi:hypothetical protein